MSPLKASEALAALQAAGIDARQAPAPHGCCRTLRYRVAGQPVNLGRLRQLAADAVAAKAAADATPSPDDRAAAVVSHLVQKFPASTPETYRAAVARLQGRGASVTPGAVLREMERPALPRVIVAPATPKGEGPGLELPPVGRLTRPPGATLRAPWDPGTDEARAAVALAALPPVTLAQDRALSLCRATLDGVAP